MRKDKNSEQVFVDRHLGVKVMAFAKEHGRSRGAFVDAWVRKFVDDLQNNKRVGLVPVGPRKGSSRDKTIMVVMGGDLKKPLDLLSVRFDTSKRALVELALREGLEQVGQGADLPAIPEEARRGRKPTRAVHHSAELLDYLKVLADRKGVSLTRLTDAILRVPVLQPDVLDRIDLSPVYDIPVPPDIEAAARRVVELAGGPVAPLPPKTVRGGARRRRARGQASKRN